MDAVNAARCLYCGVLWGIAGDCPRLPHPEFMNHQRADWHARRPCRHKNPIGHQRLPYRSGSIRPYKTFHGGGWIRRKSVYGGAVPGTHEYMISLEGECDPSAVCVVQSENCLIRLSSARRAVDHSASFAFFMAEKYSVIGFFNV